MSEYRALCGHRGTCIVCGLQATDTHMNQAHAAPLVAKATKDYKDGLRRGEEDAEYCGWGARRVLSEQVLANIAKVSPPFVLGYRLSVEKEEFRARLEDLAAHTDDDQGWD